MINNHRPMTPKGICLSGNTVRCPECKKSGALEGWQFGGPVALCSKCLYGYQRATKQPMDNGWVSIRDRLKAYRKAYDLRWKELARQLNATGDGLNYTDVILGVVCSPTADRSDAYLKQLSRALDDVERGNE